MVRSNAVVGLVILGLVGLAASTGAGPADGLIFYQDFDHGGRAVCGHGWAYDQSIPAEQLVAGRSGKACRFERPRQNLLTPNQASVEEGATGFQAGPGDTLSTTTVATPFGAQALSAQTPVAGVAWQTAPVKATVKAPHRPTKVFVFSAYLRSAGPAVKVRLALADANENSAWRAPLEAAAREAAAKDPKAAKPPLETVSTPGEATLDGTWRRVAARLEVDARREEQALIAACEVLEGAPALVLADGMQLEQTCVYPLSNTAPTSWIPGGEKRPPAWIDLAAYETGFSGEPGTLGCWVRPLPDPCGGSRSVNAVVAIGTGWWTPAWQVGGSQWYAGEAPTKQPRGRLPGAGLENALLEVGRHDGWHALVLAWDGHEAAGYLDGKRFAAVPMSPGRAVPGTLLRLGGSFMEAVPMTGDLDDVFLYARRLTDPEIAALAEAPAALADALPTVLLRRPVRTTFLRSEAAAALPLEPVPYRGRPGAVTLDAAIAELRTVQRTTVQLGQVVPLRFQPWQVEAGRYGLTVALQTPEGGVTATGHVDVFEEPAGREFIVYAWGGTEPDLEERGFNCLFGEPRSLLERGLWAVTRIDVREGVPHPWSPATRERARAVAERVARAAMAYPNVRACLVNSECSQPPFPAGEPWFTDWLRQETGLEAVPPEVVRNPLHVPPREGVTPPALVPEDEAPYRFLRWWTERGQGYYLLNGQIADWMRAAGLRTTYYSDQPEVARQFAALDLVDFWGYPKSPAGLVARFAHASCLARLDGKPFQAMPGTVYWDDGNGLWVTGEDGKRKVLCLSPDCLTENLWISVACPTSSIGLYGIGERRTGVYDQACDAAMTAAYRLIQPVGVLVGGLGAEPAQTAFLETDGLYFTQPGVDDDWMRHWLVRTVSRTLADARLPFDWVTDDHVYAGWLARYRAVVVPGAWRLPARTHQALTEYARAGGTVIADKVMRADIPGAQRLDIATQAYPAETVQAQLGGWAATFRDQCTAWAQVSPVDPVFTYTREAGPARYLFVINDHRESGPQYEKWRITLNTIGRTPTEPLRDRGLPQDVRVSIPAGHAVYDVLRHRLLAGAPEGDRQSFMLQLDPGGAAVLAAFPVPLARLALDSPARLAPGAAGEVRLAVLDAAGRPVPGRQLAEFRVVRPDGQAWAGVERYRRISDGALVMPLRLPFTAMPGTWRIEALEWVSGLRAERQLTVE